MEKIPDLEIYHCAVLQQHNSNMAHYWRMDPLDLSNLHPKCAIIYQYKCLSFFPHCLVPETYQTRRIFTMN